MEKGQNQLPAELIQKVTDPFARFLKVEAAAGVLLLIATAFALIMANSTWSKSYLEFWELPLGLRIGTLELSRSVQHWINDGLMTLFFFVIALELKRELVLGELRTLRMAILPLAGAVGGMLFPALVFVFLMHGRPEVRGWGTVMATDTAFVIGCIALLGPRVPSNLRLYLLSLAIFDDVGAILVVTFGYGSSLNWIALTLGLIGFVTVAVAARLGARSVPFYSILGAIVWLCFDASGIHPTVAGVVLGLMTPTYGWVSDERLRSILGKVLSYPKGDHWSGDTIDRHDLREASTAARETLSPVERLELRLHPWVGFAIMPLFALANAGVVLTAESLNDPLTLAIAVGLACGKPFGVFFMSWLAVRFRMATLFPKLHWPIVAAGSLLTGIGFTMSLFIAGLAFSPSSLDDAKIGILMASVISASAGLLALFVLAPRKSDRALQSRRF